MNRGSVLDEKVHCIADLEAAATLTLPPMVRDFYAGGSMDLKTLGENKSSFDRYRLRPRFLRDVTSVDASTTCLGSRTSFPLGLSPAANHCLAHPDGERASSAAASKRGINMALSMWSNCSLEDVIAQSDAQGRATSYAQNLTIVKDRSINLAIMRRAERAGYKALFISVDCPWLGRRLNEFRNTFSLPEHLGFPNVPGIDPHNMVTADERVAYDAGLLWEHVAWLKSQTKLQIWLKGILTAEDASNAVAAGADGIIVSNHGGRQLDGVLATIDALPEVVEAVRGRIPVHMDGGIRRGSDIFKALALGADYCWVGRVPLWGLAYNGQDGVSLALNILYDEFRLVMALMGCRTVEEISQEHLALLHGDGRFHRIATYPWKKWSQGIGADRSSSNSRPSSSSSSPSTSLNSNTTHVMPAAPATLRSNPTSVDDGMVAKSRL